MKTLYIDVYFLINFTVDIISLYFAAMLAKVPTNTKRLILSSIIGAFVAILVVFLPEIPTVKLLASSLGLIIIGYIAPKRIGIKRRTKFTFSFIIFEALIGGLVTFIWNMFDKYLSPLLDGAIGGAVNRKMLVLSLIVLLSIGVFRMLVSFFSNIECEGSVEIEISFHDKKTYISAFIDSGNLAVDPMDMSPVILLKRNAAKNILPENIINLCDIDRLDNRTKKSIRLIPVSRGGVTQVLVGVKADAVKILNNDKEEEIRVTIAIDKEGGTFGGFEALVPATVINNAIN